MSNIDRDIEGKHAQEIAMTLIVNGGDARSKALEAIEMAKDGEVEQASQLLTSAHESLLQAHKAQTSLLVQESSGYSIELSLLLIHAQDHLMNAMTMVDVAQCFIDLYEKIN